VESPCAIYDATRNLRERSAYSWKDLLQIRLIRPFVFLVTEPTIQVFGAYLALTYGTMYCKSYKTPAITQQQPTEL